MSIPTCGTGPQNPLALRVARAVGAKNVLAGQVVDLTAEGLAVQVGEAVLLTPPYPFEVGTSVYLCIRPERVWLQRKDRPPRPRGNQLWGEIVGETSDGLNCSLFLKSRMSLSPVNSIADLQIDLPVYIYERLGLSQDRTWCVSIPPAAIHVIAVAEK